jgi:hypothetical protein
MVYTLVRKNPKAEAMMGLLIGGGTSVVVRVPMWRGRW